MRRAIFLGCATLLLGSLAAYAGPPDVPKDPGLHSKRVMRSADGGYCSSVGDLFRCRQFAAMTFTDPAGEYVETRVWFDQWRNWPAGYANRHIECTVDSKTLKVLPQGAQVRAILDPASPLCSTYTEWATMDPDTGEWVYGAWPFPGPVTLDADLLNPRFQDRRVTSVTWMDNQTGESQKENCHGGNGYRMQGGGFTVLGLYVAFGPDGADGSYYYDTCGLTKK